MAKQITATKGGRTRTFNKETWDYLSENDRKQWEVEKAAKAPEEVKTKKEDK